MDRSSSWTNAGRGADYVPPSRVAKMAVLSPRPPPGSTAEAVATARRSEHGSGGSILPVLTPTSSARGSWTTPRPPSDNEDDFYRSNVEAVGPPPRRAEAASIAARRSESPRQRPSDSLFASETEQSQLAYMDQMYGTINLSSEAEYERRHRPLTDIEARQPTHPREDYNLYDQDVQIPFGEFDQPPSKFIVSQSPVGVTYSPRKLRNMSTAPQPPTAQRVARPPISPRAAVREQDEELCATLGKNTELRIRSRDMERNVEKTELELELARKQIKMVERRAENREDKLRALLKEKMTWQKELKATRAQVVEEKMRQVDLFREVETAKRHFAGELEAVEQDLRAAQEENAQLRALANEMKGQMHFQSRKMEDMARQAQDEKERFVALIEDTRHRFREWKEGEAAALEATHEQAVRNIKTEYELRLERHQDEKQKLRDKVNDLEVSMRLLQKDRTLSPLELSLRKTMILGSKDNTGVFEAGQIEAQSRILELENLLAHSQEFQMRQENIIKLSEATISRLMQEREVTALENLSLHPLSLELERHSPRDLSYDTQISPFQIASSSSRRGSPPGTPPRTPPNNRNTIKGGEVPIVRSPKSRSHTPRRADLEASIASAATPSPSSEPQPTILPDSDVPSSRELGLMEELARVRKELAEAQAKVETVQALDLTTEGLPIDQESVIAEHAHASTPEQNFSDMMSTQVVAGALEAEVKGNEQFPKGAGDKVLLESQDKLGDVSFQNADGSDSRKVSGDCNEVQQEEDIPTGQPCERNTSALRTQTSQECTKPDIEALYSESTSHAAIPDVDECPRSEEGILSEGVAEDIVLLSQGVSNDEHVDDSNVETLDVETDFQADPAVTKSPTIGILLAANGFMAEVESTALATVLSWRRDNQPRCDDEYDEDVDLEPDPLYIPTDLEGNGCVGSEPSPQSVASESIEASSLGMTGVLCVEDVPEEGDALVNGEKAPESNGSEVPSTVTCNSFSTEEIAATVAGQFTFLTIADVLNRLSQCHENTADDPDFEAIFNEEGNSNPRLVTAGQDIEVEAVDNAACIPQSINDLAVEEVCGSLLEPTAASAENDEDVETTANCLEESTPKEIYSVPDARDGNPKVAIRQSSEQNQPPVGVHFATIGDGVASVCEGDDAVESVVSNIVEKIVIDTRPGPSTVDESNTSDSSPSIPTLEDSVSTFLEPISTRIEEQRVDGEPDDVGQVLRESITRVETNCSTGSLSDSTNAKQNAVLVGDCIIQQPTTLDASSGNKCSLSSPEQTGEDILLLDNNYADTNKITSSEVKANEDKSTLCPKHNSGNNNGTIHLLIREVVDIVENCARYPTMESKSYRVECDASPVRLDDGDNFHASETSATGAILTQHEDTEMKLCETSLGKVTGEIAQQGHYDQIETTASNCNNFDKETESAVYLALNELVDSVANANGSSGIISEAVAANNSIAEIDATNTTPISQNEVHGVLEELVGYVAGDVQLVAGTLGVPDELGTTTPLNVNDCSQTSKVCDTGGTQDSVTHSAETESAAVLLREASPSKLTGEEQQQDNLHGIEATTASQDVFFGKENENVVHLTVDNLVDSVVNANVSNGIIPQAVAANNSIDKDDATNGIPPSENEISSVLEQLVGCVAADVQPVEGACDVPVELDASTPLNVKDYPRASEVCATGGTQDNRTHYAETEIVASGEEQVRENLTGIEATTSSHSVFFGKENESVIHLALDDLLESVADANGSNDIISQDDSSENEIAGLLEELVGYVAAEAQPVDRTPDVPTELEVINLIAELCSSVERKVQKKTHPRCVHFSSDTKEEPTDSSEPSLQMPTQVRRSVLLWQAPIDTACAKEAVESSAKRRASRRRTSRRTLADLLAFPTEIARFSASDTTLLAYDARHEQSQPFSLLDHGILSINPTGRHIELDDLDSHVGKRKTLLQELRSKTLALRQIPRFNYLPVRIKFQWSDFVVAMPVRTSCSDLSSGGVISKSPVEPMRLLQRKGARLPCGSYVIVSSFIRPLEDGNENLRVQIYDAERVEEFQFDFTEDIIKKYHLESTGLEAQSLEFLGHLDFRRDEDTIIIKLPEKKASKDESPNGERVVSQRTMVGGGETRRREVPHRVSKQYSYRHKRPATSPERMATTQDTSRCSSMEVETSMASRPQSVDDTLL